MNKEKALKNQGLEFREDIAYKGEDKYFISSFVISGRRGDPAQFFFRANEKRHAFVSSLHRLFIV